VHVPYLENRVFANVKPMPRVSVIIPTWERGQWLGRALASVLAQTEVDLEIIVVDDGSTTDLAERVVKECADSRVQYLRLPQHRGVAAARNAGLQKASAKYIAFLDDDDEWLPEKLDIQLSTIEKCDMSVGGVFTARYSIDVRTQRVSTTRFATPFTPGGQNVVTTSSVLVKKECLDRVGTFDEDFEAASDFDMWIRVGLLFTLKYIDKPLVKYYVHSDSLSGDYNKKRRAAERLVKKHWTVFAKHRRWLARQYTEIGVMCWRERRPTDACRAFWAAVRLSPLEMATYARIIRIAPDIKSILRRRRVER
jgi:glycosyltransferase involved in cell wall biosynthesis